MTKAKSKAKPITSTDYEGEARTLVDEKTFAPVCEGDVRKSRHGDYVVTGGRAPHKPESSGKIWCRSTPFTNFAQSQRDQRTPAYSHAELATCWAELSAVEQSEWSDSCTSEFYPSVIGAKWMHDSTLAAHASVNTHAEAPQMISAINKARQKARRAVRKVRS